MTKVGAVQSPTFCGSTFLGSCVQVLKKLAEKVKRCCMSILQTLLPCCFSPSKQKEEIKPAVPPSSTEDPVGKKIKGLQDQINSIRTLGPKEVVSTEQVPKEALKTVLIAAINELGMPERRIYEETLDGIIKRGVAEYEVNKEEDQDFEQVIERAGFTFLDPPVETLGGVAPAKNVTLKPNKDLPSIGQIVTPKDYEHEIQNFGKWFEKNAEELGQHTVSSILTIEAKKHPIQLGVILHRPQDSEGAQGKRYILINPNCDRYMKCSVFEDVNSLSSAIALLVPKKSVQFEHKSKLNKMCNMWPIVKKDAIVTDNDAVPFILLQALLFFSKGGKSEEFENTCRTFISDGTEMLAEYGDRSKTLMEFFRSKGFRFEGINFNAIHLLKTENLWALFDEEAQRYYGAVVNDTGKSMLISAEENRPLKLQKFEGFLQLLQTFKDRPKIFRFQGEYQFPSGDDKKHDD